MVFPMKQNRNRLAAILIAVSALALACAVMPIAPTVTPTASPIPPTATVTPTPLPTITPTPFYPIVMSGPVKVRSGGFTVDRIKGYDLVDNNGGVYMTSDDDKVWVSVSAFTVARGNTINQLMDLFARNTSERYENFQSEEPVKGLLDKVPMLTLDYTALADNKPVHGRLTIYDPENSKLVYLLVEAVGDQRWEREGQKAFEEVTASLSLFSIQPYENCPIHNSGSYGASPDWPIQIGGGLLAGEMRTQEYLDALLGQHGEPVGYYHEGAVDGKGGTLDEYIIFWGNQDMKLYFDIYHYNKLSVPAGLTCSVLLPMAP
jgi:hypothetical protein